MKAPLTRRISPLFGTIALTAGLLLAPQSARADIIDTVLGIVAPEYAEFKPVLQCIINQGSFNESVAKNCIEQEAKKQSKKLIPGDPKLKVIVDTVFAANDGDWVRVLDLVTTPEGLKTIACSVLQGGVVKDILCGALFEVAKPVLKPVLQAVKSGDWWALVTLLGPGAACGVIPGGEIKDAICGPLFQALNELGKFAKGGVKAAKDGLISFGEELGGQTQHMPPEEYYQNYWYYPYIYFDVMKVLRGYGKPSHKVEYDHCVGYFDSHKASLSSAEKWCGHMRDQLAAHRDAIVPAIKAAPAPYFAAKVKPQIPGFALDYYHGISGGKFTGPQLANACANDISKVVLIPGSAKYPTEKDLGPPPPYTPSGWACDQVWPLLNQEITAYKQQVVQPLLTKLAAAGCPGTSSEYVKYTKALKDAVFVKCDSFEGFQACLNSPLGQPIAVPGASSLAKHCNVNPGVASEKLSKKIITALGSKRCELTKPSSVAIIACTRPWKLDQCKTMRDQALQGFDQPADNYLQCQIKDQLKNEPAFPVVKKQAQDILHTLNGVKKVFGVQKKPGGEIEGLVLVPPVKVCNNDGFDPLAIKCPGNPKAPDEAGVNLPACAPDPNKDGADTPCYAGPYPYYKAKAALPGGAPGPTGQTSDTPAARRATPATPAPARGGFAPATPRAALPAQSGTPQTAAPIPGLPQGLPDITSQPSLTVGTTPAQWGATVTVSAAQAHSVNMNNSGLCEMAVRHTARNAGLSTTGAFDSLWQNSAVPGSFSRTWMPLAAGADSTQTDLIYLKPGQNILSLTLDNLNQVQESNENNNRFRVIVNLSGNCGGALPPDREAPQAAPPTGIAPPPVAPIDPAPQRGRLPSR